MDLSPQIFTAKVMHKRLFPRVNQFTYSIYYVALPLPADALPSSLLSFHNKDHGARDGSDLTVWANTILKPYGLDAQVERITLIAMPRVLGYVFNPVSFFMCTDKENQLRAVICEVHNTFGEQHSYLCARADHGVISPDDWLEAEKLFHVSPFLHRSGHYKFRFAASSNTLGIWIDYFDAEKNKQLLTSLVGTFSPLNAGSLRRIFWSHPLVTIKTIALIHWQALKLTIKGIRYISKPLQLLNKVSTSHNLTKR